MKIDHSVKKKAFYFALFLIWAAVLTAVVVLSMTKKASGGATMLPVYSVETEEKTVALTFNCAWDDTGLDELLSMLKKNGIKATFFMVGDFAERYPDAVRKIFNAGHQLGNHSMSHKDPVKMSYADLLADIGGCNDLLLSLTGENVVLYRAPSGSYDSDTVQAALSLGMTAVQWDVDSIDWKDDSPEEIYKRILSKADCGSIILFHVGKENTVAALPGIISALKAKGFSFSTVSEMLPEGETYIDATGRIHKK